MIQKDTHMETKHIKSIPVETIIVSDIEPTRKYLLETIVTKLKDKGWEKYNYGGYIFYPNGDVKKRRAYHREIKKGCSPLLLNVVEETDIDPYQNKNNIDPYILVDALNSLSDKFSDGRPLYSDSSAEHVSEERLKQDVSDTEAEKMFKERYVTSQIINNIGNLPVNITIQDPDTFDAYARRLGAWCEENSSPKCIENVENITSGMKDHFLRAIGIKNTVL